MIDWMRLLKAIGIVTLCVLVVVAILSIVFFLTMHAPYILPFIPFGLVVWFVYMTLGENKE